MREVVVQVRNAERLTPAQRRWVVAAVATDVPLTAAELARRAPRVPSPTRAIAYEPEERR